MCGHNDGAAVAAATGAQCTQPVMCQCCVAVTHKTSALGRSAFGGIISTQLTLVKEHPCAFPT